MNTTSRKMKIMKLPYPENLLTAIFERTGIEVPEITEDIEAGLEYAMSTLDDRRQTILRLRFKENISQRKVAEMLDVSPSAIGSMERDSIFKLHRPPVVSYLMYGKTGYENRLEQMRLQNEAERNTEAYKKIMRIRFEELDLSIRAFNCLRRAGYETIGDIVDMTEEEIIHIKNISWKQYDEIGRALFSKGVTKSKWIGFIDKRYH